MRWLLALLVACVPGTALACACCSDAGQRFTGMIQMDAYEQGIYDAIAFDGLANLYTTACAYECVQGIEPVADPYAVSLMREGATWHMDLTGADDGGSGRLSFPLPDQIFAMAVDPTPDAEQHTPVLYKEWRVTTAVTATGAFAPAMAEGAPAGTFILHGQGNSCVSDADFTHWTLQVSGPSADFTLFGKLRTP